QVNDVLKYKRKLNIDNAHLCLAEQSDVSRKLEKLYVYARLKRDEDTQSAKYQGLTEKMDMLVVEASAAASFVMPELSKIPVAQLKSALKRKEYANFTTIIEDIIRDKKYILSVKEEKMLSEISSFTDDFQNIFVMFDNADIKFERAKDEEGKPIDLTHGKYALLLQHPLQKVRRSAFKTYYRSYENMINTIAATYAGCVKKNATLAKIRGFKSALDKALYYEAIPTAVYDNLIAAVKRSTPSVHKYVAYRKRELGLRKLHMYDMYVPITKEANLELNYEDAYALVVEALKPLGEKYTNILKDAYNKGWIDVEETKNKRNGAYSWGCYDSQPVVLLNYKPTSHDVFTIAHEMGHAIHTYMSNNAQPYEKSSYTIFVAEIASTVNEVLLLKHLLKTAEGDMKKFLLSYYLDMFRTTLFRQTMFSEFEKYAHEEIEKGNPITAESLSEKYLELNKEYYGKSVVHDEEISREWARIPHFYRSFYVYKYATGLTAAVNIAQKILTEEGFVEKYYKFLSAGCSLKPLDSLLLADVDLTKVRPFTVAMREFRETLGALKKLK
ncbi:MAG: oligoendopeptidase F, partial [Clostridia bacterium]